jgi:hypothetical protein
MGAVVVKGRGGELRRMLAFLRKLSHFTYFLRRIWTRYLSLFQHLTLAV